MNKTLLEWVRCRLLEARLPKIFASISRRSENQYIYVLLHWARGTTGLGVSHKYSQVALPADVGCARRVECGASRWRGSLYVDSSFNDFFQLRVLNPTFKLARIFREFYWANTMVGYWFITLENTFKLSVLATPAPKSD
jgi:hypothetical protein